MTHKMFFLFYHILLGIFIIIPNEFVVVVKALNVTTAESPAIQEMLQKVIKLTAAKEEISKIFKDSGDIEKQIEKLLNNSEIIGMNWFDPAISKEIREKYDEFDNLRGVEFDDLPDTTFKVTFSLDKQFREIIIKKYIDTKDVMELTETFIVSYKSGAKDLCSAIDWTEIIEALQYTFVLFENDDIPTFNPTKDLHEFYQLTAKKMLIYSTFCDALLNGPLSAEMKEERKEKFLQVAKYIDDNLTKLFAGFEKKYWKTKAIKQFFFKTVRITAAAGSDLIASALLSVFNRYYAKFGYNYHIGVSDAANGFTNSVTFCKTECHYFYNYHEKNVYILRNKISQNGYQKCDYLEAFKDNEKASDWCDNNFGKNGNVYGDLRDFANDITLHCNIYAISVVKTSLKYKDDFEEKMAFGTGVFEFPCFGQINVAISNYPL